MIFVIIFIFSYIIINILLIKIYNRYFIKKRKYRSFVKEPDKKKYTSLEQGLLEFFREGIFRFRSKYLYKKAFEEIILKKNFLYINKKFYIIKGGIYLYFHPILETTVLPVKILVINKFRDKKNNIIVEYLVESKSKTPIYVELYNQQPVYFIPQIYTENQMCFAFVEEIGFINNILHYVYIKFVLFFYKYILKKQNFKVYNHFVFYLNIWDKLLQLDYKDVKKRKEKKYEII